jgi:phosphomannomutase
MYWAVTESNACAGIEITASHNPINYNGLKIVKSGSQPLNDQEAFQAIKLLCKTHSNNGPQKRLRIAVVAE